MVPLATLRQVDAAPIPARLTPAQPGRWRWLDVRTLRFEPAGRLPMATRFAVEVPAGTRAPAGGVLARTEQWSFITPAPRALGAYPNERAYGYRGGAVFGRQPVLFVGFDQRIEPAAVLGALRMTANGRPVPLRLATAAEIEADSVVVRGLARRAPAGRWLAFRPAIILPLDAVVRVLAVEVPSAEGPLRTRIPQTWQFRTYAPLRVTGDACGWEGVCRPGDVWRIEFNNPIDGAAWRPELVRVEPALPGMSISRYGGTVLIRGRSAPNTRYTVILSAAIRDVFGQTLGRADLRRFDVGPREQMLESVYERPIVLDPAGPPTVFVRSRGNARLRVRLFRIEPEAWRTLRSDYPRGRSAGDTLRPWPGELAWSGTVTPEAGPEVLSRVPIDLAPALRNGTGMVLAVVEPDEAPAETPGVRHTREVPIWAQATRIGLTTFADGDAVTTWATSLVDGRPIPGVTVRLLPGTGATAVTDAEGLATLPLPTSERYWIERLLSAQAANGDEAVMRSQQWNVRPRRPDALWYLWTDRDLYRPGEQVYLKGWVRPRTPGPRGGLRAADPRRERVVLTAHDQEGKTLRTDTLALTALGGFDTRLALPAEIGLGRVAIGAQLLRDSTAVSASAISINVQEYRRPEFRVGIEPPPGRTSSAVRRKSPRA